MTKTRLAVIATIAVVAAGLIYGRLQAQQRRAAERRAAEMTGGDPRAGRETMQRLGCIACHSVPGMATPNPQPSPPLIDFAAQPQIAGLVENTPENLMRFISDPRSIAPQSAMPKVPIVEKDLRDMAAFLYTPN